MDPITHQELNNFEINLLTNILKTNNDSDIIDLFKKRQRQLSINKASRACRIRKKEKFIRYENHIIKMHKIINSDYIDLIKNNKLKDLIDEFNKIDKI